MYLTTPFVRGPFGSCQHMTQGERQQIDLCDDDDAVTTVEIGICPKPKEGLPLRKRWKSGVFQGVVVPEINAMYNVVPMSDIAQELTDEDYDPPQYHYGEDEGDYDLTDEYEG